MYVVENTSDTTQRFNEADPQGGFRKIFLAPGESGTFDIDPGQARFHRGGLKVSPVVAQFQEWIEQQPDEIKVAAQEILAAAKPAKTKPKAAPKRAKA